MEIRKSELMFADVVLEEMEAGKRTTALLNKLDGVVPWERLAKPIRKLYRNNSNRGGRPNIPVVKMLKATMLSKWFGLSDPMLEELLVDRASFRKFYGLQAGERPPDETTMVVFRRRLREADMYEKLFRIVRDHLNKQDLIMHDGTIVDATIIEQSRGSKRKDGTNTRDKEASFTKKHGQRYHGYKMHTAVDRESGLIINLEFSTARDHDSRYIDDLIKDENIAVIADTAYCDRSRYRDLLLRGVIPGIIERRVRGQKELHEVQKRWNKLVARLRAPGELPFAWIKHWQGLRRVRYRGLQRNKCDAIMHAIAFNFRRMLPIVR